MVNYFCKTLGGEQFKLNHIRCDPQKLFELLMPDPCKQVWDVNLVQQDIFKSSKGKNFAENVQTNLNLGTTKRQLYPCMNARE